MKNIILALGVLASLPAFAIDKSNQENVGLFSQYLFASVKAGSFQQDGKTSSGDPCHLVVSQTRFGVELGLSSGKTSMQFRVSVSGKTSQQFEITDSDENVIEAKEVLLYSDERDATATREQIKLLTRENPGQAGNVASVSISNEVTYDWTQEGKADFTKASAPQSLSCSF